MLYKVVVWRSQILLGIQIVSMLLRRPGSVQHRPPCKNLGLEFEDRDLLRPTMPPDSVIRVRQESAKDLEFEAKLPMQSLRFLTSLFRYSFASLMITRTLFRLISLAYSMWNQFHLEDGVHIALKMMSHSSLNAFRHFVKVVTCNRAASRRVGGSARHADLAKGTFSELAMGHDNTAP